MKLLIFLFAVCAATTVIPFDAALECMEAQAGVTSITIATRTSDRTSDGPSISAPGIVYAGCFGPMTIPLPIWANESQVEWDFAHDVLPPTLNQTLACAAQCGEDSELTRAPSSSLMVSPFFVTSNGTGCVCTNATISVLPVPQRDANVSRQCGAGEGRLFYLQLPCALNTSGDCGDGCSLQGSCCLPNPSPDNDLPSYYRTMIQWLAVIVIILAVLEAIVYVCLRRRLRQRAAAAAGGAGGGSHHDRLRAKAEARDLTERLLRGFPASPSAQADGYQDPNDDDACPICLEPLRSAPSLELPCLHNIHSACLRDFVTHALTRSNEAGCPLCRAPIVGVRDIQTLLDEPPRARRTAMNPAVDSLN